MSNRFLRPVVLVTLCAVAAAVFFSLVTMPQESKDTYVMPGGPLGKVTFEHKKHAETHKVKCETCHHPSKPEKPLASPQQACRDCHTKVAVKPMKTNLVGAFHKNAMAAGGLCIDCHKAEAAKGKKPPAKCVD